MKPNLREFAREIGNSIIITRYLSVSQHLKEWREISKDKTWFIWTMLLNKCLNDICGRLYQQSAEWIFFSSVEAIFIKIDHMLDLQTYLNRFKIN